jgi:hypothetical protein
MRILVQDQASGPQAYAPEGHVKKITVGIDLIFRELFIEHNPRGISSAFHPSKIVPTYGAGRASAEIGQKDHLWMDTSWLLEGSVNFTTKPLNISGMDNLFLKWVLFEWRRDR